jgi:hypothetical protein
MPRYEFKGRSWCDPSAQGASQIFQESLREANIGVAVSIKTAPCKTTWRLGQDITLLTSETNDTQALEQATVYTAFMTGVFFIGTPIVEPN